MTDIRENLSRSEADEVLRDYHDARRREDQWRIPQLLLALVTPIAALIAIVFNMAGSESSANIAGGLAVITGVAAALMAVEVWRWHRIATSRVNAFRTDYASEVSLLMKDPI
jgi:F0F1-type ATP synthase assembly protein I